MAVEVTIRVVQNQIGFWGWLEAHPGAAAWFQAVVATVAAFSVVVIYLLTKRDSIELQKAQNADQLALQRLQRDDLLRIEERRESRELDREHRRIDAKRAICRIKSIYAASEVCLKVNIFCKINDKASAFDSIRAYGAQSFASSFQKSIFKYGQLQPTVLPALQNFAKRIEVIESSLRHCEILPITKSATQAVLMEPMKHLLDAARRLQVEVFPEFAATSVMTDIQASIELLQQAKPE